MRAYLARKLKDFAAAEDIVSQAFIRLAAELDRGTVREPAGYLWAAVKTLLVDEARRREREQPHGLLTDDESPPSSGTWRLAHPLSQDLAGFPDDFDLAVRELPESERDVFILTELRGLDQSESAELLGVSQPTVSRRRAAALDQLKDDLAY